MLNSILHYFDLQSARRSLVAEGTSANTTYAPVFPQYIAVAAGVLIDPFLHQYINTSHWGITFGEFISRGVFALIMAVVILPGIYKSAFDPDRPLLIQLAALFTLGIGWQSLFATAVRAGASVTGHSAGT